MTTNDEDDDKDNVNDNDNDDDDRDDDDDMEDDDDDDNDDDDDEVTVLGKDCTVVLGTILFLCVHIRCIRVLFQYMIVASHKIPDSLFSYMNECSLFNLPSSNDSFIKGMQHGSWNNIIWWSLCG